MSTYGKDRLQASLRRSLRRDSVTWPDPPCEADRTVRIDRGPTAEASRRTSPTPTSRAIRAWRSPSATPSAKMTAATFVMSALRDGLLDPHPEMPAAFFRSQEHHVALMDLPDGDRSPGRGDEANRLRVLDNRRDAATARLRLDEHERPAFDLQAADDHGPRAARRIDREDLVPCAQLAEVLRVAVGQVDVRVHGACIDSEGTRADVSRFERLGVDEEKPRGAIPHEHPLPGAQQGARVDAHAVAEAERPDRGDRGPFEWHDLAERFEDRPQRADLLRPGGREEDAVHADLHRFKEELRLHGIVDFDEEASAASLEVRDQVLQRDDLPILL